MDSLSQNLDAAEDLLKELQDSPKSPSNKIDQICSLVDSVMPSPELRQRLEQGEDIEGNQEYYVSDETIPLFDEIEEMLVALSEEDGVAPESVQKAQEYADHIESRSQALSESSNRTKRIRQNMQRVSHQAQGVLGKKEPEDIISGL